jgi:hypothetical protein
MISWVVIFFVAMVVVFTITGAIGLLVRFFE